MQYKSYSLKKHNAAAILLSMFAGEGETQSVKRAAITTFAQRIDNLPRVLSSQGSIAAYTGMQVRFDQAVNDTGVSLSVYSLGGVHEWNVVTRERSVSAYATGETVQNHQAIERALADLFTILDGNDVEVHGDHVVGRKAPLALDEWSDWGDFVQRPEYINHIHPRMIEEVNKRMGSGHIVDIFGGDGSFLSRLQQEQAEHNRSYTLLEANTSQCQLASRNPDIEVNQVDLTDQAARRKAFSETAPPAIVTAIGGICYGVVTAYDAHEITRDVFDFLPTGGLFIVTGISPTYLDAASALKMGFKVLNKALPENLLKRVAPYQLYIFQK